MNESDKYRENAANCAYWHNKRNTGLQGSGINAWKPRGCPWLTSRIGWMAKYRLRRSPTIVTYGNPNHLMKKSVLRLEEPSGPKNIERADVAPANGYTMVVDGHFKTNFLEEGTARKAGAELLANFPMLRVEIYNAITKTRALLK